MAIQSSIYNVDGSTRTFPSTKHIATKQHCAVYVKSVALSTWSSVPVGDYSLINNSVVFDIAPSSALYSEIEVRVVDSQGEIVDSPSDISIVAGAIANINTNAVNIDSINTNATNIGAINTTSGSIANVNLVAPSIANVNLVGQSIANVNTTAANIASINSVNTNIVPNLAEILLADTNAATATTQATNSSNSATLAYKWATEAENVVVLTGQYSAFHWATKAAASALSINTDTTFVRKDSDTGAATMPAGTTAQRKSIGLVIGDTRWNTTIGANETWNGSTWVSASGQMLGTALSKAISYNSQVINENITVPADVNFSMVGPVTVGNGFTVTVTTGARGVVL